MLTPKKRLGQHFLIDPNTARKIVGSLKASPDDPVLEIGPGTGALTGLLVDRYKRVTAIEVDPRAAALIKAEYPSVDVLQADILTAQYVKLAEKAGGALHVIGNLPYNITSQILFSLLDEAASIVEAVVMMQYEVAQRIVAQPSTKAYGILSVALQLGCVPELLFPVSRNVFRPKPDVRSAVVRLDFSSGSATPGGVLPNAVSAEGLSAAWIRRVIRTAFNQRRKTLKNSLKSIEDETSRPVPDKWAGKRAEELAPQDFVELAGYLQSAF